MKGKTLTGITAATIMTVGLGAGVAGGLVISEADYNAEMDKVENDQAELANVREDQLELDRSSDEVLANVGEACTRLIMRYSPSSDSVLAGTSESVIVDDLLRVPGQPCGEVSTDVREDVRSYIRAEEELAEKEALVVELENSIHDRLEDPMGSSEDQAVAAVAFGAIGLLIGGFSGAMTAVSMDDHYRKNRAKFDKRQWNRGKI